MKNFLKENKKKVLNHSSEYFLNWAKGIIGTTIKTQKEPHGDEGLVYKISSKKDNYFLKIKVNSNFLKERERLEWLKNKLPVPRVVGFAEKDGVGAILLTALEGKNLAVLCKEWPAKKVIDKLVDALHQFHKVNSDGWPFEEPDLKKILVHGDACLPNFIFNGDLFSGYIDVADSKLAKIEVDLSAAVWSIQYNLGKGHGAYFLKKYGYKDSTDESAEELRLQYENYQKEHGFLLAD